MKEAEWIPCPECGNPHFIKRWPDTELKNFPAWCKKCKKEINMTIRAESRKDR